MPQRGSRNRATSSLDLASLGTAAENIHRCYIWATYAINLSIKNQKLCEVGKDIAKGE